MTSETERNKAIIKEFFAASEAGEDVLDYLVDDAEWWVPGHWRLGGTYNKEEVGTVFDKVFALMDGTPRFTFNAMTAEEDRVAVDCEGEGRFKDGEVYRNTYHFLFVLRDGKITKVKEFLNTALMSSLLEPRFAAA